MFTRGVSVTALAAILVVALALLGVVYGLWFETLTINGSIRTGRVSARWSSAVTTDPPGAKDLMDAEGNRSDKDVGELECSIDPANRTLLKITIKNGYPGYFADCEVAWINDGTIPVKVVDLRAGPEGGPLTSISFDEFHDLDLSGDGLIDINLMMENGLCTQVDPGQKDAYSVWVHVKQPAPQGTTLKFVAETQLNQWNESSPPCAP